MNDLVLMTFAFLLPLAPAYLLYRLLPSATTVGGPFKGLNLQLSGSFAGYFLLTLLAFGFLTSRPKPTATDELWEVTGTINCHDSGNPIDVSQLSVHVVPSSVDKFGDGRFIVRVPARRDSTTGAPKFPMLVIEDANHETVTINLNADDSKPPIGEGPWRLAKHPDTREISVTDVISLRKKPAYPTTGVAPPQVVLPSSSSEATP